MNNTNNNIPTKLAGLIDHSILKPNTTYSELLKACRETKQYNFASICVKSANVKLVYENMKATNIPVCSSIGFPFGAMATKCKVSEAIESVKNGAKEIDMVINIGALKSLDF